MVGPRPQTPRCFEVFPKDLQPIISSDSTWLVRTGSSCISRRRKHTFRKRKSVDFYDQVIAPYKGDVEAYYIKVIGIFSYFKIIFLTLWVVIFPKSGAVWKVFPNIPAPPDSLKKFLNYN